MNEKFLALLDRVEEQTGLQLQKFTECEADAPLSVTIIGQPQQNLFGIIGQLLQQADQLDTSLLHGYRCEISYGEEKKYFICDETGESVEATAETLYEALMSFGSTGEPLHCTMQMNHPLLKGMTIRLIASDDEFDDVDTDEIVTSSDYCFMTLNAIALLSMSERKILRKGLLTNIGNELGVLLTNSTKVPPENMKDVTEMLDVFFKGACPVYDPEAQPETFAAAIGALQARTAELHAARNKRALRLCVDTALAEVRKTIALISEDEANLEDAVALMKEKAKALPKRQEAASRRCRMKYTSMMQVEYAGMLSEQNQKICQTLETEIDRGTDMERMRHLLPGYIQNEWNRTAAQVYDALKVAGKEMEVYLADYIQKDVLEYFGEDGNESTADYIIRLTNLYPEQAFRGEGGNISADTAKDFTMLKKGGVIAAGVGLAMFGHPLFGVGLAIYAAIKVGKHAAALKQASDKQALKEAAKAISAENYSSASEWLDGIFAQMNESINACVSESYSRLMDGMLAAIRARQTDAESKGRVLAELKDLEAALSSAV